MQVPPDHPARGFYVFAPEDLDAMKRELEQDIIPLAILQGSLSDGVTAKAILAELQADPELLEADAEAPRERANIMLKIVVFFLAEATTKRQTDMLCDWDVEAAAGARLMTHLFGYLSALNDQARETPRAANEARRAIGADKRARIAAVARDYQHSMSKDRAAPLIAEQVGLSAGRVRKTLSKLAWDFPPKP